MTRAWLFHDTVGTAGFWWTVVAVAVLLVVGVLYLAVRLVRGFLGRRGGNT